MSKHHSFHDTVNQIVTYGIDKGILHLYTGSKSFDGTAIMINDKPIINFGSCSYLGLEFDPRVKAAACEAIKQYGTQFSASRAYISLGLYGELEHLLEEIFQAKVVIVPTTTLGHIANIPVLVEEDHAVIMDQQVHNSVQTAVNLVKAAGVHVEIVRHNRMDLLEERIKALRHKYKKIWYMADGIYSMFGDCSPVDRIYQMMDEYPELYYYVDDAHGMSIHGTNGRGFVLSQHNIHPKMALVTSLNKAFASGGGALIFGDPELARKVGTVGGPLLSSGPMQPSGLGAAIAVAKIHLSDEITAMQAALHDNISYTKILLDQYKLPVVSETGAAIFFIGVSLPKLGHKIVHQMLEKGFYVNLGVFPTVPMKQTGIRFTITRLHTKEEIQKMIATLAAIFPVAMNEEGVTLTDIYKAFKLTVPEQNILTTSIAKEKMIIPSLKLEQFASIKDIEKKDWDKLFEGKGSFDWEGLKILEGVFTNNELPEDNWSFDYLVVKDHENNPIVATFLTSGLWKDDMLSAAGISAQIENRRKDNPYYLTSKVLCSGSLLTEGEHLFINYDSPLWKEAMQQVFKIIYVLQEYHHAEHIILRDFHGIHEELDSLMVDNGFFRIHMPDSFVIPSLNWHTPQDLYESLSLNCRNHLRKKVLRHSQAFEVEVINVSSWQEEIEHWYDLYQNVKEKSLELNTFSLPFKLFRQLALDENWEVLQLTLRDQDSNSEKKPCCVIFSYKSANTYVPMVIGIDYTHNHEFGIYRQALYQLVLRARKTGKQKILLGFSAGIEKQKLGAIAVKTYAYMHTTDSFNMEELNTYSMLDNTNNIPVKILS
ncbi:aminotransferase class I/II-fold pyridoxal phosphate-dependent enzyme [Ferruginibacter sp.]|nr:aminotransferase class I/II-fold pyridoxal phosphate-dependent enzyme [Ferruginibacter sp.]